MDEKELKTSPKQRFFIILIAVLMIGSIVAGYAAMVIGGASGNGTTNNSSTISPDKLAEYEMAYSDAQAEFATATAADFDRFIKYRSEIKAFNEAAANNGTVEIRDLEEGTGRELGVDDTEYLAYYVGWCADETIFDSSFNNKDNPTSFTQALDVAASPGMIEGWKLGVEGMKLGGIREITMSSELAYKEGTICEKTNQPLKFIVLVKERDEAILTLSKKVEEAGMRFEYARYGMDYDEIMNGAQQ